MSIKLLALDPSSSAIGYALSEGPGNFPETGVILPTLSKLDRRDIKLGVIPAGEARMRSLRLQLVELIQKWEPERAVIEIPSGHVARHGGKNARAANQFVYCKAVGVVEAVCWGFIGGYKVDFVQVNKWTRGVPKDRRIERIKTQFPDYNANDDKGGDQADAIGLAQWWWVRSFTTLDVRSNP